MYIFLRISLLLLATSQISCNGSGKPFDYLMFTTIYPAAVCRADDDSVPDSCEIPEGTPQWSVHGLWPNFENGSYPQFCNGVPKHFDGKLIIPIEKDLLRLWPNLYPTKTPQSFWKHEYDKHGTCAQSDDRFGSELAYFTEVMKVFHLFNISEAMSSIGPSEKPLHSDELEQAVGRVTGGKRFQFNCLKDKKTKKSLLGDIRLCLNHDLTIRDCPADDKHSNRVSRFGRSTHNRNHGSHGPPLPSFQPCPNEFIYLAPESPATSSTPSSSSSSPSIFGTIWKTIKGIL